MLIVEMTLLSVSTCSDSLVWIEHDSHLAAHSLWWQVVREVASDGAGIAVWGHYFTPLHSEPGVIDGVLNFLNVSNFLSLVELGS